MNKEIQISYQTAIPDNRKPAVAIINIRPKPVAFHIVI